MLWHMTTVHGNMWACSISYPPDKLLSPAKLGAKMDNWIHLKSAHIILSTGSEVAQEAFASITVSSLAEQGRKSGADGNAWNSHPHELLLHCMTCTIHELLQRHCMSLTSFRLMRKDRSQLSFCLWQLLCYVRDTQKWRLCFWYCQKYLSLLDMLPL